jgi:hypothetical protein
MGEEIMFDVEKQITQWRNDLLASETLAAADVGELETHLREEISHLRDGGLPDAEAFLVARHRLGDAAALEEEFAKVNTRSRLTSRFQWMAAGVLLYILVFQFSSVASSLSLWLGFGHGLTTVAGLAVVGGAVRVLATIAAVLLALWSYSRFWRPRAARPVSGFAVVSALVAMILATAAMYAIQILTMTLMVKSLRVQAYASIAAANNLTAVAWTVLIPILLMCWIAAHHLRGTRRTSIQA